MSPGPAPDPNMLRSVCQRVFTSAYEAVAPDKLVAKALRREGQRLTVRSAVESEPESSVELKPSTSIYVAAFGKASLGMTRAVQDALGVDAIKRTIISSQYDTVKVLSTNNLGHLIPHDSPNLKIMEGARNNLPDAASEKTASEVEALAQSLGENDLLITLISGGGSALLPAPVDGVPLADKLACQKALVAHGATIQQLNAVRQNLSRLKNGGLARAAYPAKVISLIFSDIIENDLPFVASGPTVAGTSATHAWNVIESLGCATQVPDSVRNYFQNKLQNKSEHVAFDYSHVINALVGDNQVALRAARDAAKEILPAANVSIIRNDLSGEAGDCGIAAADWLQMSSLPDSQKSSDLSALLPKSVNASEFQPPFMAIFGGETTVTIRGKGKGGRNQEMVLAFLLLLIDADFPTSKKFAFISAGTDGQDGPTEVAGVVVDEQSYKALKNNPDQQAYARECLKNNDSYHFFQKFEDGQCFIHTGLTGTNVMDIQILAVS